MKFGLCLQEWKLAMQSGLFKNAAAGVHFEFLGPFFFLFLFVAVFFILLWMQAKYRGSHGEISIAAAELCSLFTVRCKTAENVRFYPLALSRKQRGI